LDKTQLTPVCSDLGAGNPYMVIGVAATDKKGNLAHFSNYGNKCIDIAAPGYDFYVTLPQMIELNLNKYYDGFYSGTSLAAPVVSGAFALIKSINPYISNNNAISVLLSSANKKKAGNDLDKLGNGFIDVDAALKLALKKYGKKSVKIDYPLLAVSPQSSYSSEVEIFNIYKNYASLNKKLEVFPYKFQNGVNIILKNKNILATPGVGGGPQILEYNQSKRIIKNIFLHNKNYRGGLSIAKAKFITDNDIIVGMGKNSLPYIEIYNQNYKKIDKILAYNKNYRGGLQVAAADVNGDNTDEIVTGTLDGGGPHVRIFNKNKKLISQFFAYDKNFRGGVNVCACDLNGDGVEQIVTGPKERGGPQLRVFNIHGKNILQFFAFDKSLRNGLSIACADTDFDGVDEIITGNTINNKAIIRVFNSKGYLTYEFEAFPSNGFYGQFDITTQ
jgi:hypothetical protein